MRVLFYVGDADWSGGSRVILTAARGLAHRGHPVAIACCGGSRLDALASAAGLDTVAINAASSPVGGAWDLRKRLQERFIEVVVVSTERDQLIVSSAMRLAERGAVLRRIPSFDGVDLQRGGRLALRIAAAGLIFSTEREATDRHAASAAWAIAPTVVPLGVDAATYESAEPAPRRDLGAPSTGGALLIACTYDPSGRYRIATVFRTLALLAPRHTNVHVVIFGAGSLDQDLRMHAAALGVSPVVRFIGDVEDERAVMRAADVGWVVAGSDNGALACLDYMALRKPVIAERSPLTQHYVADGITGLLLSPGDPSYTASGVAAFLAGADQRVAMGNAGRTRVQRDFTETAMIDGFERAVNAAGDRTKWAKT
jgi:glycosyltransferase involved in cell wall biosynthesis